MVDMDLPYDAAAQRWLRAAGRGVTWFESRLDASCRMPASVHDLGSYYKWPLALAALGRMELARQVLDVIVDDFMTSEGDFRSGEEKSADPIYGLIADTYTNTWPIVAARVLERPDVAEVGLGCLRQRHVPQTGGYLTGRPGQHSDGRQDIVTIAGCGNAFLACGHAREAIGAGDCLLRILAGQEGPANPFYLYIDGDGKILDTLELPERLTRIRLEEADQAYVYLGMAAIFLARLYMVAEELRFLEGARGYFVVNRACGERALRGTGCCKTGWAAAGLFRITGESQYRDVARRAAEEVVAAQQPTGDWPDSERSDILECDVVGELSYHLGQYCLELASTEGNRICHSDRL